MQSQPDGYLDLWSREHYKSTIITYGLSIQDILASHGDDPIYDHECTIGIFSHTRPVAKKPLRQIQFEFESNQFLKSLFPDILYENPRREAPSWSLDTGIIVKRKSNPKEATVEGWGVVDGQPTGSHFSHLVYDDIVTLGSVSNTDMIEKTTTAVRLSFNLGSQYGHKRRFIGTRYRYNDSYKTLIESNIATPRLYPATDDGTLEGSPVFWAEDFYKTKIKDMGSYVAACQLLQDPKQDSAMGFKHEWLRHYENDPSDGTNKYIIVDAANEKKKKSDYTAIWVIAAGSDNNLYAVDIYRDKLSLTERTKLLLKLHRQWRPIRVGYEKYGKDSDIEHIKYVMEQENYRFDITELGGSLSKNDRIRGLMPLFESHRIWLPRHMHKTDWQGVSRDLVKDFIKDEYEQFPVPVHDDLLDSLARVTDTDMHIEHPDDIHDDDIYDPVPIGNWMSA